MAWYTIEIRQELEGDSSVGYSLDISMTAFEEHSLKRTCKYGAQGQVEGLVDVEVCTDLFFWPLH